MAKRYSRLASVEQRKNIKNAYYYIFLSITSVILLIFFGIPMLVKFAGFVGDVAKSDKPVEINDITPPAPPQFDDIPEFTSKESLDISGTSENGAIITIRSNGNSDEIVANSEGKFNFVFNLRDDENSIDAIARDPSGNESTQTKTYKIFFDNTEPKLEIESPTDGASFYGTSQRQLQIRGTVDERVDLTINERVVTQKDDDSFSYTIMLSEGENKFDVKAVDPSGNETSTSLTVNFSL